MTSASQSVADRADRIVRLTSTPLEAEAGIIVAALEQQGIKATMTGEATAGFRAEAPGWVQVLVAEDDLARAANVLNEVREGQAAIDWDYVDVGEPAEASLAGAIPNWTSLKLWRRIAYVLVVVYLLWVAVDFVAALLGLLLRAAGL